MSRTTLLQAYTRLPPTTFLAIDGVTIGDEPARKADAYNRFNRVMQRFHDEGKWKGTMQQASISVYGSATDDYYFTLPRQLETAIFVARKHSVQAVQSAWFQFLPGGPGPLVDDKRHIGAPRDLGEGYVTFRNIETAGTLVIDSDQTEDASTYLYLRGLDANGEKIYSSFGGSIQEGIRVDLGDAPVTTSESFSSIYYASKEVTKGNVTISRGGTEIASYEPGEETISYRRYLVGLDSTTVPTVKVWGKRRWCWTTADNDLIYPDNLEALKLGVMATIYEENGDFERSQAYMAEAYRILSQQITEHRAGEQSPIQFVNKLGPGSIPYIN